MARQEALPVAHRTGGPDGVVRDAADHLGPESARLAGAAQVWWWIGPILLYVLLPVLDRFFGPDGQNPPRRSMERLENDKYYRYCTYIYIPFQLLSVVLGATC